MAFRGGNIKKTPTVRAFAESWTQTWDNQCLWQKAGKYWILSPRPNRDQGHWNSNPKVIVLFLKLLYVSMKLHVRNPQSHVWPLVWRNYHLFIGSVHWNINMTLKSEGPSINLNPVIHYTNDFAHLPPWVSKLLICEMGITLPTSPGGCDEMTLDMWKCPAERAANRCALKYLQT